MQEGARQRSVLTQQGWIPTLCQLALVLGVTRFMGRVVCGQFGVGEGTFLGGGGWKWGGLDPGGDGKGRDFLHHILPPLLGLAALHGLPRVTTAV